MIIRDTFLWASHIEDDPELAATIRNVSPDDILVLRTEGRPVRFRKMRDGAKGPTDGVKPDPSEAAFWQQSQTRRRAMITVEAETVRTDPYMLS